MDFAKEMLYNINRNIFCFIGNFVPIKQKELNARAKFSANSGNAHGRTKRYASSYRSVSL
ncbi:MAG: hypothetical protein E7397_08320 [Ruminococcaceae bacterium]|nr:hypothetical protein [Oscillospiraceae bacterium]